MSQKSAARCIYVHSLRTDTQIAFSLHFTPLGIRLSAFVAQPLAFLVLETIIFRSLAFLVLETIIFRSFFNPLLKVSIRLIV